MAMRVKTVLTITKPPDAIAKDMRQYQGDCMIAGVSQWAMKYLAPHFNPGAATKYGYQRRTKHYMLRKAKKMHHQQPLVYTGESRARMLGQMPQMTGRGAQKTVTATWTGLPFYFTMPYKPGSVQPNKRLEVISTLPDEAQDMAKVYLDKMDYFLRQNRTQEVTTT